MVGGLGVLDSWEGVGLGDAGTLWPYGLNQFPVHGSDTGGLGLAGHRQLCLGCILRSTAGFPWPAVQF